MIAIFHLATRAAQENPGAGLADTFELAAQGLAQQSDNASAQLYALGLSQFATQFRRADISLEELLAFVRSVINDDSGVRAGRSGELLKALLAGLAGWQRSANGQPESDGPLDMRTLFDLGIAYMQARQHGGTRAEILAEAAASSCPVKEIAYRRQSGKLAIQALLEAMAAAPAA